MHFNQSKYRYLGSYKYPKRLYKAGCLHHLGEIGRMSIDHALIWSLGERWWLETTSFHFSVEEATWRPDDIGGHCLHILSTHWRPDGSEKNVSHFCSTRGMPRYAWNSTTSGSWQHWDNFGIQRVGRQFQTVQEEEEDFKRSWGSCLHCLCLSFFVVSQIFTHLG